MSGGPSVAWLACCAALVLTGCSGADEPEDASSTAPSSSSSPADTPAIDEAPDPKAGLCYRLSLEDAARPTSDAPPVPCTEDHTARTVHVGRLETVVDGRSLEVDSDRVQKQLADTCPAELDEFLGGDAELRALSRFEAIWFSPTLEEYDAGAMWFRCDVVAVGRADTLLRLPSDERLQGILDRPGSLETYGLCGTAEPGAEEFERVACALRHSWVAISTIPIEGGDVYPGVDKVREAGDETCSDEVSERNGLALEYRYGWEWPTEDQWDAGQRYGFCWAPSDPA